jgi:glutamine synthetase
VLDPFWDRPTLSFICDLAEADTREPYARDPRRILKKAIEYMKKTKIADRSLWGPEFEFYIFSDIRYGSSVNQSFYEIDAEEAFWNTGEPSEQNLGYWIPQKGGYHEIPPHDKLYNLRALMVQHMEEAGIPVYYHHHEVGGPGQMEIEIEMGEPLAVADSTMWGKYIVKMVASRNGQVATFMPKPLFEEAGSGMHFHQHLFKGKKPLFYDKNGYAGFSKLGLSYIAGILHHADGLLAWTNPSTNSYKRLVPGYEAPVNCFFSLANRSAAIRIPKYATAPADKRMEFRPPDATCNIYLAIAAQLLAGLDGIQKELDPTELGYGPIDEDVFLWDQQQRDRIRRLPGSLGEALHAVEKDHHFLTETGVFPTEMVLAYAKYKYEHEHMAVRNRPHPYEMKLYFEA